MLTRGINASARPATVDQLRAARPDAPVHLSVSADQGTLSPARAGQSPSHPPVAPSAATAPLAATTAGAGAGAGATIAGATTTGATAADSTSTPDATSVDAADGALDSLAELVLGAGAEAGGPLFVLRFLAAAARRPGVIVGAVQAVRALPRLDLRLQPTPTPTAPRRRLTRRRGGLPTGRLAVAVQQVPLPGADPLDGPRWRRWRQELSRARRAGITCATVTDPVQRRANVHALIATRGWGPDTEAFIAAEHDVRPDTGVHFAAHSPDGDLLSVGVILLDGGAAFLAWHESVRSREGALARYALAHAILTWLVEHEVPWFVACSTLGLAPGLRFYQHRLAFREYNLRIVTPA